MQERELLSPLPGIFYRRASPEAEPYVKDGDRVKPGDVIGLVEAMKMFNEVAAEVGGTLVRFLVENEGEVEAGQPLALIAE